MPRLLIVVLVALTLATLATAEPVTARPGGPRVRPQDDRTAKFLEQGLQRSMTMRSLVERIEASDVIVYVGIDPLMKAHLAGSLRFMTSSGTFRYLRAAISRDQSVDSMIATLAHEFQHVLEVVGEPAVVDDPSLVALYRRIGVSSHARPRPDWETVAAQATGAQVRRELISAKANVVTSVATVESDRHSRDL